MCVLFYFYFYFYFYFSITLFVSLFARYKAARESELVRLGLRDADDDLDDAALAPNPPLGR